MGSWPFTRLHFGCGRCVVISGPHIQVLDTISGQILNAARCTSTISCSAVDEKYTHLITTGDDKKLNVWELVGLQLKSSRELPKKATVIHFTHDGQTILVADKFGDVFSYTLAPPIDAIPAPAQSGEPKPRNSQASHENPHGALVLGHASIITSFLLSHDGRHIITADRDEHIRVSRYPQGYIIERYCLGHQLYVSAICLPGFEPSSLVSGGGDPSLHIWDWMSGKLKCQIPVADAVRPFLKVKVSRPKWHKGPDGSSSGSRGRKGRSRGKEEKGKETQDDITMEDEGSPVPREDTGAAGIVSEEGYVLALTKMEALEFDKERLLVFSAVGGSALFYCRYSSRTSDIPSVQHLDFARPVLDFVLGDGHQLLVSVDAAWSPVAGASDHEQEGIAVRLIEWHGGEFKLVDNTTPLQASLNGAGMQEASADELASLELYSDLALLPKHAEGPEDGDGPGDQDTDMRADTPEGSQGSGRRQHAKVVGRLKTKQALLRKQELDLGSSRSVSGDERDPKKIKLDKNE